MVNRLKFPYSLVIYIIPFGALWDFLSIYYQQPAGPLQLVRAVILVAFIAIVFRRMAFNSLLISIIVLMAYTGLLLVTASDIIYSLNLSTKIFITFFMLPLGYGLIQSYQSMKLLNEKILNLYLIILSGFILYNIFGVGGMTYVNIGFDTGGYSDNWNILTYSLLLAPMYFTTKYSRTRKIIFYVSFILLSIILFLSFKRIAVAGLIFGFSIFAYNYGNYGKVIRNLLIFIIVIVALSPTYLDGIYAKYEARQAKFNIEYTLEKEGRSLETRYILEEIFSFKDPAKSFWGGEAFNSVGKYAGGIFDKRNAHVDYNLILISNGIMGLLLYLNIYLQIIIKYRNSFKQVEINKDMLIFKSVFWALLFTSLLTSFAGQMYSITFRSIIFLYLGAILGVMSSEENKKCSVRSIHSNQY